MVDPHETEPASIRNNFHGDVLEPFIAESTLNEFYTTFTGSTGSYLGDLGTGGNQGFL
jgi:hypothetical protein